MIRQHALAKDYGSSKAFRWRSREISRIEGLSDAVFGFAITLLIVALEVPETFSELTVKLHEFVGFAISFMLIFQVWFYQYRFFRRYGIEDTFVVWMNGMLLFVVLFYVYPLKFFLRLLSHLATGGGLTLHHPDGTTAVIVTSGELPILMMITGLGFAAVFSVFALLYRHAYKHRLLLELNELEQFETRDSIRECVLSASVGLISAAVASVGGPGSVALAGLSFGLLGPAQIINGLFARRARRRLDSRGPSS